MNTPQRAYSSLAFGAQDLWLFLYPANFLSNLFSVAMATERFSVCFLRRDSIVFSRRFKSRS